MDNFDKYSYRKIHEIAEEVLSALKKGQSISSCEKMLDFLGEDELTQEFLERMKSPELYMQYHDRRMKLDKEQDIARLVNELNQLKNTRKRRIRKLYLMVSAVAASVLVFISVMWLWEDRDMTKAISLVSSEIEDLYEKPTLILEDGSVWDVQKLADESVETRFGISKMDYEKIAYKRKDCVTEGLKYNTLIIPAGYTYKVLLADGSEVVLNAGSRLKYPVAGDSSLRHVELEGEAYFKIVKSVEPFVVKMGDTYVKVYGTQFNSSYDVGENIEVVLVEGSIGFNSAGKETMLKPNQKCGYNVGKGQAEVCEVNVREYVAWLDNKFDYEQVPLTYFLKKVSAWYGVQFKYNEKVLENIDFYISASRNIALSDLLLLIEKSTKLTFIRESDHEFVIK